jgi:hypothetical protein
MTARREEMTTVRLAGAIVQGAAIDMRVAGTLVAVPRAKVDADDLVFRVARFDLREFGIERGDLLIVEPRPEGDAATAELVLVTLRERTYVGRSITHSCPSSRTMIFASSARSRSLCARVEATWMGRYENR